MVGIELDTFRIKKKIPTNQFRLPQQTKMFKTAVELLIS